ncbi:MAG: hypothetical protein LBS84_08280 [Clostridiales bacterium]|jgi:hypothetical protein|nr:hypothetical protein [Clostridiales bacterium]
MGAYTELYLPDIVNMQGRLFFDIRDELPNVDEKWFIEAFMKSRIRALLDIGNWKYANMPPKEVMSVFLDDECPGGYQRGEEWGGFLPQWVGQIYAFYQWKYCVRSSELINVIPLDAMRLHFRVGHQMGLEAAADRIYDDFGFGSLNGELTLEGLSYDP